MEKKALFSVLVLVLAALNLGTIRRAEDPIRDTQTNPILYEQKKEEEKDGKKGALLYSVKYNPPDKFLVAPPVAPQGGQPSADKTKEAEAAGTGWWEETPPVKQGETLPSSQGGPSEELQGPPVFPGGRAVETTPADQEAVAPTEAVAPGESPAETPPASDTESAGETPASKSTGEYWW